MTYRRKLKIKQYFKPNKFQNLLKKVFPRFKGYWLPIKYIFSFLPSRLDTKIETKNLKLVVPLDLKDPYQIDIFFNEKHELVEPLIISQLLPENGIYFDVGANCGWFTRIISTCKPDSLILAFEPNKLAFSFLSEFCSSNVLTLPVAVGDSSSKKLEVNNPFYRQPSASSMKESKTGTNSVRLDDIAEKLNLRPNIIKIDVEGFEIKVLNGADKLLNIVDHILIEVNNSDSVRNCNYDLHDIYELMDKKGFNFAYIIKNYKSEIQEVDDHENGSILFSRLELSEQIFF